MAKTAKLFKGQNMKREKEKAEPYGKCKRGAHMFGPTGDPWYEKCYHCPALRRKESITVDAVKKDKENGIT